MSETKNKKRISFADEITYRKATVRDIDSLAKLDQALVGTQKKYTWYYGLKKNYFSTILSAMKKNILSKKFFVCVAVHKGELIGYCSTEIKKANPITLWKREANLSDLFVLESYRSRGVGTILFSMAEEFARKRKAPILNLQVLEGNKLAEELYLGEGMELFKKIYIKRI